MVAFLGTVAVLAYLVALMGVLSALAGTDLQWILAGVFATCGTVAAAGAGIIHRLAPTRPEPAPSSHDHEFLTRGTR